MNDRWLADREELAKYASEQHPHGCVFTTLSGSDLYGFPSVDGDYDLRGSHVLSMRSLNSAMLTGGGMDKTPGLTIEVLDRERDPEMDFVSHDIGKLMRLALRGNGYVLEQITSPLIIESSPWHEELVELVPRLVTRKLYYHYNGFFSNQERLYDSRGVKKIKGLLYRYRVALTGMHALRAGVINANLVQLNEEFGSPLVTELVRLKQAGEQLSLQDDSPYLEEIRGLSSALLAAFEGSRLPLDVDTDTRNRVEDFLWRCRLETVGK